MKSTRKITGNAEKFLKSSVKTPKISGTDLIKCTGKKQEIGNTSRSLPWKHQDCP